MPVGTKATVKIGRPGRAAAARRADHPRQHVPPALPPRRRRDRGARRAARVHARGTGRSSPTPAASRSSRCATRCSPYDDDGVTFRSVYDGAAERFTPELAAEIQRAARLRRRDVPRHLPAVRPAAARARGGRAAHDAVGGEAARPAARARASCASRSRRAASTRSSARAAARSSSPLDFDGYAIGGLSVGEERGAMFEARRMPRRSSSRREGRATSWASATRRA